MGAVDLVTVELEVVRRDHSGYFGRTKDADVQELTLPVAANQARRIAASIDGRVLDQELVA